MTRPSESLSFRCFPQISETMNEAMTDLQRVEPL